MWSVVKRIWNFYKSYPGSSKIVMCFGTEEFGLLLNEEGTIPKNLEDLTTARFEFNYAGLKVLAKDDAAVDDDHRDDREGLRLLGKRLQEIPCGEGRKLFLHFRVNTVRTEGSEYELVSSVDVVLEGELLKELHSAMALGEDEGLVLALEVDFSGVGHNPDHRTKLMSTDGHDAIELRPQQLSDGTLDHGKYICFDVKLNLYERSVTFGSSHSSWNVSNLNLIVKPLDCRDRDCRKVEPSHVIKLNMKLLAEGLGSDVEILAKGNVPISCHGGILIAQSPVLEKMLKKGHFAEGATRKVDMIEWSPVEVKSFLAFLYYGGMDNAIEDASLNLALFKIRWGSTTGWRSFNRR